MIWQAVIRKTKELRVNLKEDENHCVWTSVLKYYAVTSHKTFLQNSQLHKPLCLKAITFSISDYTQKSLG